jgi:preprotein translocase subunit SecE
VAVSPAKFVREVLSEAEKVTWPGRRETMVATGLVLAMAALTAVFFFFVDQIIRLCIGTLFGVGG